MKKINIFIVLLISTLLSGCASVDKQLAAKGPVFESNFEKLVLESIASKSQKSILFSPGSVRPDSKGMEDRRPVITNSEREYIPGVLVLTDEDIFLQQWDEEKLIYKNVWKISHQEINTISLYKFGAGIGIVIHKKNDTYVTINFGYVMVDPEMTEKAFLLMKQNLKLSK